MENVLTEDGKCDTEIRRRVGISKDALQKLSKLLMNKKLLEAKKSAEL